MPNLPTTNTYNSLRFSIMPEEVHLKYPLHMAYLAKSEQKQSGFLHLNPCARIPVHADHDSWAMVPFVLTQVTGPPGNRAHAFNRYFDRQSGCHELLAGSNYSIADITVSPVALTQEQQLTDYPFPTRWLQRQKQRPAVQRCGSADVQEVSHAV